LAYFLALPMTIRLLLGFGSEWFTPALTADYYLALVLRLLLTFGIVFELPVVISILASLGIVTPAFLRSKRRHAIVIMTVLASVLSPGDFGPQTILLLIPLVVLYEVSIGLATVVRGRRSGGFGSSTDPAPLLLALGLATARWRNRVRRTVAAAG
jgi:sec-independent protein translocase protein TatC